MTEMFKGYKNGQSHWMAKRMVRQLYRLYSWMQVLLLVYLDGAGLSLTCDFINSYVEGFMGYNPATRKPD